MVNSYKGKTSAERKPRKELITLSTKQTRDSRCRNEIKKHHEMMKNDPERLTTEFLINITGCECRLKAKKPEQP